MNELTAAFIGALAAYAFGFLQARYDRRRRRRNLATVMLADLAAIDDSLREAYEYTDGRFPASAFRTMELVTDALAVFSPETVAALLEVNSFLGSARELQQLGIDGSQAAQWNAAMLRGQLIACAQRIPVLKAALEREGGRLISSPRLAPPPDVQAGAFLSGVYLPPLPPSPFARPEAGADR